MGDEEATMGFVELVESFRATIEHQREMGLGELLIPFGEELPALAPLPPPKPRNPQAGEDFEALRQSLEGCTRCPLHEERQRIVFGAGDPQARLVFVGEGPGAEEDRLGEPFVGAAGQLLDKIIQAIGLTRAEVFICNVVKCRPPKNRTPLPNERATCGPFLERQLELINPEIIVALGATAASYLLGIESSMSRIRGRFHERGNAVVMPTYHPAYLLRTPSAKRAVWEDMKMVRDRLGLAS